MNSAPSSSQYHERDFVPEWLTPRPFDAAFACRQIGVLKQKIYFYIGSWLTSFILVAASYQLLFSLSSFSWDAWSNIIYRSLVSFSLCLMIVPVALTVDRSNQLFKYVLFFSITVTSAFGLTKTLTGSHAESGNIILYGFSFYTASIAYLLHSNRLSAESVAIVSNPLLLITGPVVTCFSSIRHHSFRKRFEYFFPYILVGLFLHQTIATPLDRKSTRLNSSHLGISYA